MVVRGSTMFVGRIRELDELERALESTQAGTGMTVLITGEVGIGKTRLISELGARASELGARASELGARASERGFEVLLGRSIDLVGTELPYQPFLEALRPLGKLPSAGTGTAGSQLRLFEDTLTLLSDNSAAAPLLLVF
jgi:hypothetical protein